MTNTNTEKLPDAPEIISTTSPDFNAAEHLKIYAADLSDIGYNFAYSLVDDLDCGVSYYICDQISEWIELNVDCGWRQLLSWLSECNDSDKYMEDAVNEFGLFDGKYSFFRHLQCAQTLDCSEQINSDIENILTYAALEYAVKTHPDITEAQWDALTSFYNYSDFERVSDIRDAVEDIFETEN